MMRPMSRVVVRPNAGINLRNDYLHIWPPQFIDFFPQESGGVKAVCPYFYLLRAVLGDHLKHGRGSALDEKIAPTEIGRARINCLTPVR